MDNFIFFIKKNQTYVVFSFFQHVEKPCKNPMAICPPQDFQMAIRLIHTASGESLWPQERRWVIPSRVLSLSVLNAKVPLLSNIFYFVLHSYLINWIAQKTYDGYYASSRNFLKEIILKEIVNDLKGLT